jgi:uncharacterized protein (TIGR02996 family)
MSTDRDALLAAIRANPDEDTPRLMFADWLDENGDPDRAEFVRLQCELAQLEEDDSDSRTLYEFLTERDYVTKPAADWSKIDAGVHRRIALETRANDLARRHIDEWTPKLPKAYKASWAGFRRGFAHRVELGSFLKLGARAKRLRAAAPAVTLVAGRLTVEDVGRMADAGLLDWLAGLDLRYESAAGLRALGDRPEAAGVRDLRVWYDDADAVLGAVAESPHWSGLRSLVVTGAVATEGAAVALFGAAHLRTLRRLHLVGTAWTATAARALAANGFSELLALRLSRCGLDDDAAEVLAACPDLARLRGLDLDSNALTGRGVTALLCAPALANLAYLGIGANPANGLDAKKLAALAPGALRMLHAHGCQLRTPDVRALARSPRFRNLWYLDLDSNGFRTAAVRELVRGFGAFCPPIIWMTHNRIDDRGAELLANWPAARALRVLHLKFNDGMTDSGVRAVLDSPHLAGLEGLGLSTSNDDLNARMKARFRHHDQTYY